MDVERLKQIGHALWLLWFACVKIQIGIALASWIYYRIKAIFAFFKK